MGLLDRREPRLQLPTRQGRRDVDEVVQRGEASNGGGVAELLMSYIPLLRGLGIKADWQVIRGDARFFSITKNASGSDPGG